MEIDHTTAMRTDCSLMAFSMSCPSAPALVAGLTPFRTRNDHRSPSSWPRNSAHCCFCGAMDRSATCSLEVHKDSVVLGRRSPTLAIASASSWLASLQLPPTRVAINLAAAYSSGSELATIQLGL